MIEKLKKDNIKEGVFFQAYLIPNVSAINEVRKKMEEIAKKDLSFSFAQAGKVFIMSDIDKDRLHKKCLWLVKNVEGLIGYKIKEIQITDEFIKGLVEDTEVKVERKKRELTEGLS